ncbi:PTS sugar transporter subunit IIA [Luteimonas sp. M1R5S18]|jgi:PTS system nitrogen regulatory IIA component|uniref:PTS sugar transporter subunit IIA n=1 Tax=Luteimonas rhizosphaericola TaxID=3042024 RepID=A0ABT6JKF6_9GAMM|nr:PTS sugar transporter subunit IIA [Luteimonas rhizosphaericola]MDH5831160.1 PTS sugar transporter subunit IIA [Luteimonas rhizosphaericola]
MPWTDLLSAERIVVVDDAATPGRVLDAAARLLSDGSPASARAIAAALRQREQLGSTAIGHGVALPHARSAGFHAPRGAFLRLRRPVDFDARDGEPVDLVFAMSATDDRPEQHLQHLADIAGRFADADFRRRLRAARGLPALRRLLLAPAPAASAA